MKRKIKKNTIAICGLGVLIVVATYISKTFSAYNMKYVLIFTNPKSEPFAVMKPGSEIFYRKNCPVQSCYITDKPFLYTSISTFDIILFHGPEIIQWHPDEDFPIERSPHQSYIFTSMESSHNYNVPDSRFNNLFNFSWTYKLNSNISFKYMVIKDREGKVIGPSTAIDWINIEDMSPINNTIKIKLANKSIAAAWFVSNCKSFSGREKLAFHIAAELNKYNMSLDIFGACGWKYCPRKSMKRCLKILQRDYYFYFAFENSISDDYVTEKLRNALQSYVVPIVYGGAKYKRFMPDGIYLNARYMNVKKLVKRMVGIIKNKQWYYDFFKWHNHYSYHHPEETPETDPYCSLCSFINNINNTKASRIEGFYDWWSPKEVIEVYRKKYILRQPDIL